VTQTPALPAKQRFTAAAQLLDLHGIESIQRARQRRLIGKLRTPPGASQGQVGP
jgi:hypothetical protein